MNELTFLLESEWAFYLTASKCLSQNGVSEMEKGEFISAVFCLTALEKEKNQALLADQALRNDNSSTAQELEESRIQLNKIYALIRGQVSMLESIFGPKTAQHLTSVTDELDGLCTDEDISDRGKELLEQAYANHSLGFGQLWQPNMQASA